MHILETQAAPTSISARRAWYTLAVLVPIMMFNNIDRYIMAVLIQPIKQDLGLSDTQIGLLTGFAFSAFYALAAVPVARLADSGRRHLVIWGSALVWSTMTALTGAAQSFAHMLLARFLVGAGEAGALPASQSLICDVFPAERRNTALAIFVSSAGFGVFCAFALGGLLEQRIGWRLTFPAVGLPCLLLMFLFMATVRDPHQRRASAPPLPMASSIRTLLANRTLLNLYLGTGFLAFLQLGLPQWLPAFLERSHGLARSEIGIKLALATSPGMVLGILVAGPLADALARRNRLWPARIIVSASLAGLIPLLCALTVSDHRIIFGSVAAGAFLVSMPSGLVFALCQSVVAPNARAMAAAGAVIATSFIGLGALPFCVGLLSDLLSNAAGRDALRWSLLIVSSACLLPIGFFFSKVLMLLSSGGDSRPLQPTPLPQRDGAPTGPRLQHTGD